MRVPVWGIQAKEAYPLDEDYVFEFNSVSLEELFAGKINALLDRSAARDLYDVYTLSGSAVKYDTARLRKALILFGLTRKDDFRKTNFDAIDRISQKIVDEQLNPLRRRNEVIDLDQMKIKVKALLAQILQYKENEQQFLNRFLDEGDYEPELLFDNPEQAQRMKYHPAVLWKLQNHRKLLGFAK